MIDQRETDMMTVRWKIFHFNVRIEESNAPINSKHQHPPPPPKNAPGIWTFEGWLVQIPASLSHPSTGFDGQMPLLKIKCLAKGLIHFWWSWCWVLNKSLARVIPRDENLSKTRFIANDKCFLNDFFAWERLLFILQWFYFQSMAV